MPALRRLHRPVAALTLLRKIHLGMLSAPREIIRSRLTQEAPTFTHTTPRVIIRRKRRAPDNSLLLLRNREILKAQNPGRAIKSSKNPWPLPPQTLMHRSQISHQWAG